MFQKLLDLRFRHKYMILGSVLVTLLWVITDPSIGIITALPFGGSTIATLLILLKVVLYVGMLHISRLALFDYINLSDVFGKAVSTPQGAGLVAIAISIAMLSISITMFAATSS